MDSYQFIIPPAKEGGRRTEAIESESIAPIFKWGYNENKLASL